MNPATVYVPVSWTYRLQSYKSTFGARNFPAAAPDVWNSCLQTSLHVPCIVLLSISSIHFILTVLLTSNCLDQLVTVGASDLMFYTITLWAFQVDFIMIMIVYSLTSRLPRCSSLRTFATLKPPNLFMLYWLNDAENCYTHNIVII